MTRLMICADLKTQQKHLYADYFKQIKMEDVTEIHFVHAFQEIEYGDSFFMDSLPNIQQYKDVKSPILEFLDVLAKEVVPDDCNAKIFTNCTHSITPKSTITDYADKNQIDNMVIATRGLHGITGLFSSSFSEYMIRHAHCTLTILREK